MRKNTVYTLGRSSKNSLYIKNDKSISRLHISLEWKPEDNVILIKNEGKLSKIGSKYLQPSETIEFDTSANKTELSLGTVPICVKLEYLEEIFDIPNSLTQFGDSLKSIGIDCKVDTPSEDVTKLITMGTYDYRELYACTKDIKVFASGILTEICNKFTTAHDNFDESWRQMESQHYRNINISSSIEELSDYSTKIFFILYNVTAPIRLYLKPVLQKISLEIHENVHSIEDMTRFLSSSKEGEIPIILHQGKINNTIITSKAVVMDANNIFNSFNDGHLYREVLKLESSKHVQSNSNSENNQAESIIPHKRIAPETTDHSRGPVDNKRKRVRRQKVQPLNSLSFFAGGIIDTTTNSNGINGNEEKKKSNSVEPVTESNERTKVDYQKRSNSTGLNLSSNLDIEKPVHQLLPESSEENTHTRTINKFGISEEEVNEITKNGTMVPDSREREHESPIGDIIISAHASPENSDVENHSNSLPQESVTTDSKPTKDFINVNINSKNQNDHEPSTLKSETLDASLNVNKHTKSDIVKLVQNTKMDEVKRLHSDIVHIKESELTEEAINQLGNLTIVEPMESLLRRQPKTKDGKDSSDAKWKGRQNFKKFVKVQPKYKNQETNNTSRTEFIRKSASLLTRDYVLTTKSRPDPFLESASNTPEINTETSNNLENDIPDEEDEELQSFSFTRNSNKRTESPANTSPPSTTEPQLFVIDDDFDDSQDPSSIIPDPKESVTNNSRKHVRTPSKEQPLKSSAAQKRKLFNFNDNHDSDSDDDEDRPRFKFSRQR